MAATELLHQLVFDPRVEAAGRDGRIARLALTHVDRTLHFLEVCMRDFREASEPFIENFELQRTATAVGPESVTLTEEEVAIVEEGLRLNALVQFRIETFFFFSQRLLDEVVVAMDAFFPGATTLGRHRRLARNLQPWLEERGLTEPPELQRLIGEVTDRVKQFRDEHVAHLPKADHVRKTRGLAWGDSGELRLSIVWMFPRSEADVGTKSDLLSELMRLLDDYIACVLGLFLTNLGTAAE